MLRSAARRPALYAKLGEAQGQARPPAAWLEAAWRQTEGRCPWPSDIQAVLQDSQGDAQDQGWAAHASPDAAQSLPRHEVQGGVEADGHMVNMAPARHVFERPCVVHPFLTVLF